MTASSSGARVVFEVNGAPVLFANAISYEVKHDLEPLYHLDHIAPAEYYETHYSVRFTINTYRVPYRSATSQGLIPTLQNIVIQPELRAVLIDKVTLSPLFSVNRIKCTSEIFNISARDIGRSELSFVGISITSDYN